MTEYLTAAWDIWLELAPWLLLGAAVAGLLHVLLPPGLLRRHLSGRWGVVKAVAIGVPLPLCSCGVIPVGLGLKKSGASDGASVGFLISTPQTGVDSVLVTAAFLGWPFALFKLASAAVLGVVGGWLTGGDAEIEPAETLSDDPLPRRGVRAGFDQAIELLRSIWWWLVIGVLVSAALTTLLPSQTSLVWGRLAEQGSTGLLIAMAAALLVSLPLYICATASVPIAAALVASGMPTGAALVFLMAGPATNVATIGAVYRTLGIKPLVVYLLTIIVGSIAGGLLFDWLLPTSAITATHLHDHTSHPLWAELMGVGLFMLMAWFAMDDLAAWVKREVKRFSPSIQPPAGPKLELSVDGMSCQSCVSKLRTTLQQDEQIETADVKLHPGRVTVRGDASEERVRSLIKQAGFNPM